MDKIVKIVGGIVILGAVVALVLWLTGPSKRELPPVLRELSTDVAHEFAATLPRTRDVNDLLVLLPRKGNQRDEEVRFRQILRDAIVKEKKYNVSDWEDLKKKLDETKFFKFLNDNLGLVPGDDPKNLEQMKKVIPYLNKANISYDGILIVNVKEFDEGDEGYHAKVTVNGDIYAIAQDKVVASVPDVTRSVDSVFNYTYLHNRLETASIFLRFFGWFLVASTLPFAMIAVVRAVVQKRKNELNLALVVAFTLIDVVLAWVLISAMGYGTGTILFVLMLTGLMGYYNYDACDYIERRLT